MRIMVTGSAGFIGHHVARHLLEDGHEVIGLDNYTPYYDVNLKEARTKRLTMYENFSEHRLDLADRENMDTLFRTESPQRVVHLAAQAGVRHSLTHPHDYASANMTGFLNILEGCRTISVNHLVYASTSSIYGANGAMPFSAHTSTEHPMSLYAASKKANEMMAHSYAHLFSLPCTGVRFFTVYGPWGRPDMALFLFADAILNGRPVDVFNHGKMQRDFTYVEDIANGIVRLLDRPAEPDPDWNPAAPDPATSGVAPYRIYNIGSNRPVELMRYIELLEDELGQKAEKNMLPMQPGDVPATWADIDDLIRDTGYTPDTPVEEGVHNFVKWYLDYYGDPR